MTRLEIGVNVDVLLDALRTYFVRSAREAHNKGTHMDLDAADPEATLPEGYQPLEVQLEALEAFHTFWKGTLRTFKVKCMAAARKSKPPCQVWRCPCLRLWGHSMQCLLCFRALTRAMWGTCLSIAVKLQELAM